MSTSKFCIQQRQREQQQLKKLLILGFAGSALFHGLLAYALPHWSFEPPKQVQEPMELILVDKPKPKPKVESKTIVKPAPKPEAAKAKAPPSPVKPPEPVKAETPPPPKPEPVKAEAPPPKPEPVKAETPPPKVLTAPKTAPAQPVVNIPAPEPLKPLKTQPSSSVTAASSNSDRSDNSDSAVATNSAPSSSEVSGGSEQGTDSGGEEGISCVSNCEPEYPGELEGVEGTAGVKLTIDPEGNVVAAELADADDHSQINRQALLAARQMQFSSPPGDNAASVQVKIDFTVEGSEYDRLAREAQEKQEQAQKERQEKEAAEKQAQQERLNREREAKALQEQQPQPQQPSILNTPLNTPTKSKPLPAPLETEVNDEQLREFRERMEKYRED